MHDETQVVWVLYLPHGDEDDKLNCVDKGPHRVERLADGQTDDKFQDRHTKPDGSCCLRCFNELCEFSLRILDTKLKEVL